MKKLLNPRGYLSWTQISLWLQDPEKYVRHYMYGESSYTNAAMAFGSKTATALETGAESDDELINILVAMIPKYDKPEHEIKIPFKTKYGVVYLLGKIDNVCTKTFAFFEYKTGRTKWTTGMARKHKQVTHYTALIWLAEKILPPKSDLVWAQTDYGENGVELTGHIETFDTTKTLSEVLEYLALVTKVAREIDERYRKEIKNLT